MQRIVVLGTGTGVGKTFVTAHLARALRRLRPGARPIALKPIESGVTDEHASDSHAIGSPVPPLHAFVDPISPHLAARRAGVQIEIEGISRWVEENAISISSDMVIIETAGGVLSPLSDKATNLDLALALEPAQWLLIAPDSLGVLHDLSATLIAMATLGRKPDHVVLSQARPPDAATGTHRDELARLGITPVCAVLGQSPEEEIEPLARAVLTRSGCD